MPPVKVSRISHYFRQRIVNLRNSGKSYVQISNILAESEGVLISREAIGKFYRRYVISGSLNDPPKRGARRRILSERHMRFIDERINADNEISAQELARVINDHFGITVGISTIKRARKDLGWTSTTTQYCQMVREQNKPKRLGYALQCLADNEQFEDVIFTDETTVKVQTSTGRSFRKRGHGAKKKAKPKHPYQVHVWGGISRKGATGLYVFANTMDSLVYQGILRQKLVPFINDVYPDGHRFMQDNDPKHVSKSTKDFMTRQNINHWVTPPESPDMNPIENLWASLKFYIRRRKKPSNQQELIDGIKEFWETVTPDVCCRYIDHLFKVIPKVVEVDGNAS